MTPVMSLMASILVIVNEKLMVPPFVQMTPPSAFLKSFLLVG